MEASQDIDRRGRREEALDRIARQMAIGSEGPEGLIPVVEDIVDADECLEAAPAGGQSAIEHPVGGERRLKVGLIASKELRADIPRVRREREPGPRAIGARARPAGP